MGGRRVAALKALEDANDSNVISLTGLDGSSLPPIKGGSGTGEERRLASLDPEPSSVMDNLPILLSAIALMILARIAFAFWRRSEIAEKWTRSAAASSGTMVSTCLSNKARPPPS